MLHDREAGAQFLRFLIVGAFNTLLGYGIFCAALLILPNTFLALCVSTLVATSVNFFTTGRLVFGSRDPRLILRFYGVYGLTFLYNAAGLRALEHVGVAPQIGGLILLPGAVTASYLLNRRFVFGAP